MTLTIFFLAPASLAVASFAEIGESLQFFGDLVVVFGLFAVVAVVT
jgi:hypothetical protein